MRLNKLIVGLLLTLALSACGDGSSGVAVTAPVSGSTTVQASSTGVTSTNGTVTLTGATVQVPAGTSLTAADGTPVTGPVTVDVTYSTTPAVLPSALQTPPADTTLKAFVDIVMTGNKRVKSINPAITVTMTVPLPNGTVVDIYSHGSEAGATWVKEGSATVTGGVAAFSVSHFSVWGCFQKNLTGITGGSNGGVTAN